MSGFSHSSGKRTQVHRVGEGNFSNLSLKAMNKGGYNHITTQQNQVSDDHLGTHSPYLDTRHEDKFGAKGNSNIP